MKVDIDTEMFNDLEDLRTAYQKEETGSIVYTALRRAYNEMAAEFVERLIIDQRSPVTISNDDIPF